MTQLAEDRYDLYFPAKEMHKQRRRKLRKTFYSFAGHTRSISWRCHLQAYSHVFCKSRLERHRAKINIADDPFIQLRGEWSAQLTLIHHSPLAIKTRASTRGTRLTSHRMNHRKRSDDAACKREKARKFISRSRNGLKPRESNLHPAKAHVSVPWML